MRGDSVVVRCFGGQAAVMIVWDEIPETVYVLAPERFEPYKQGASDYWPVGFSRADVFCYDEKTLKTGKIQWDRLVRYRGEI